VCSYADDMTHPKNQDVIDADQMEAEILAWLASDSFSARAIDDDEPCCTGRTCPKCRPQ